MEPKEPIWEAAVNGHWDTVKQWLGQDSSLIAITGDASLDGYEFRGLTLLHLAAGWNSDVSVLKYLVSHDIDVNIRDDYGMTPLHTAARNNPNVEVLKYLVSQGADADAKDITDYTPLYYACTKEGDRFLRKCIKDLSRHPFSH